MRTECFLSFVFSIFLSPVNWERDQGAPVGFFLNYLFLPRTSLGCPHFPPFPDDKNKESKEKQRKLVTYSLGQAWPALLFTLPAPTFLLCLGP